MIPIGAALRAAAMLIVLLLPDNALGHAVLLETSPADGVQLEQSPQAIRLRFSEPVRSTALSLRGPGGEDIPLTAEASSGGAAEIVAALPALAPGIYHASWRVLSLDGHPIGGTIMFGVGSPAVDASAVSDPAGRTDLALRLAFGLNKVLLYGATLTAAGGAIFLLMMRDLPVDPFSRLRRWAIAWALAGMLLSVSAVVLQTMLLGGGRLSSVALAAVATGSPGASLWLRLAGLGVLAAGISVWPSRSAIAASGGLLAIASFAATGHALAAGPSWAMQALVAVHVLVAAFWIGALWPLLLTARQDRMAGIAAVMTRFSAVATLAVPVLVLVGLTLAWQLVGGFSQLFGTTYGIALTGKVALVAGMLMLAALNKWRFLPALLQNDERTLPRLRRSIGLEVALAAAILAATAVLTSFGAPGLGQRTDSPYTVEVTENGLTVTITVDPGHPGENQVDVRVRDPDGAPRPVLEARLTLARDDLSIAGVERDLERIDAGHYRLRGPELSIAGTWQATLELLVTDFEKRTLALPIVIEAAH
ncbi:MAG TPA: CopD family protein [Alphaproteobacteria bacterium]|nr:CopD family protein [Alphaproteobacteria bacterium]